MKSLRAAALIATAIGAAGSIAFMLNAGRESPRLLQLMIGAWVVSPFAGLACADALSARWSASTRTALHAVAVAVTVATLTVYGAIASSPTRTQTPFFVMVPPASWLFMGIVVAAVALLPRKP